MYEDLMTEIRQCVKGKSRPENILAAIDIERNRYTSTQVEANVDGIRDVCLLALTVYHVWDGSRRNAAIADLAIRIRAAGK